MKTPLQVIYLFLTILFFNFVFSAFRNKEGINPAFPYQKAGLTERQAAAHLLSRFTYGARPGDIDQVVKIGLENWFLQQLEGNIPDDELQEKLTRYPEINLSNAEVADKYQRTAKALRIAIKDGVIKKDSINKDDKKNYKQQVNAYVKANGLKPVQELFRQFINQKIIRAAYTNNQLQEVLTDFWFNHFNVSISKNQCAAFVPAYERDVIRPNVTGRFADLLLATAKSPAMLLYLDNFSSSGSPEPKLTTTMRADKTVPSVNKKKQGGLNENYAREVMELHTMGVDGGYTQNDVTQAAMVLTGWTVKDAAFYFAPRRHDEREKTVLGKHFAANGGYQEGVELLELLAHHPATAKFISTKLATRFVNDHPSGQLVGKMAKTFSKTNGDIRQVMITMVTAPEFWTADAVREKTKSPFELAMSAVRSFHAEIEQPYQLYNWVSKMGQKLYYYQAPTGFPDRGQYWINTGSLLNRMNFGLAFAAQRIPGVKVNLPEAVTAEATGSRIGSPEFQRR